MTWEVRGQVALSKRRQRGAMISGKSSANETSGPALRWWADALAHFKQVRWISASSQACMNQQTLWCWKSISLALRIATFAFPLATYILQELLFQSTGLHLRAGDAAIHLIWTCVVGAIGLLLALSSVHQARKAQFKLPALKVTAAGMTASLILAAIELYSHDFTRFCGGSSSDCGVWN